MSGRSSPPSGENDEDVVQIERSSPEEVFSALASDIRIDILLAMMQRPDEPLEFSALRSWVGVDDPGQFHYHLDKLVNTFVRKTDDGYELTHAGREVVGAIYAGTYTANAAVEHIPLGELCITCGGNLYLEYADESVTIRCEDCERQSDDYPFPPRGLDQFSREELATVIGRWMDHYIGGLTAGFCPVCTGQVDGELVIDHGKERLAEFPAHAAYMCRRCQTTHAVPGPAPVHTHPSFRHFIHTHGFDVQAPIWQVYDAMGRPDSRILSDDPARLEVSITHDGETFAAVVDETATVVDIDWDRTPE